MACLSRVAQSPHRCEQQTQAGPTQQTKELHRDLSVWYLMLYLVLAHVLLAVENILYWPMRIPTLRYQK